MALILIAVGGLLRDEWLHSSVPYILVREIRFTVEALTKRCDDPEYIAGFVQPRRF